MNNLEDTMLNAILEEVKSSCSPEELEGFRKRLIEERNKWVNGTWLNDEEE